MQTLQSPNLQQIYDAYWDLGLVGIAVTVGLAALLPFIQSLRREGDGWHWPIEPLRSICLLGLALATIYPAAGWIGKVAESPHPGIIYVSLSGAAIIGLILHLAVLRYQSKATESAIRVASEKADEIERSLAQLREATDIDTVFERPSDPLFVEALTRDLRQATFAHIFAIGHTSLDEWADLWKAISNFVNTGGRIRLISDSPLRNSSTLVDFRRVPEVISGFMRGVFAVDCGGPFYFGIGSVHDDLVIARFDGRSAGKHSLASGVFLLTSHLARLLESGLHHAVTVRAAMSPADYKEMILSLESEAARVDRLPKRLFVVFKSTEVVRYIAEQRYGTGSIHIKHYVEEHQERAAKFFAALGRGMICREIYNKSEVLAYVQARKHGRNITLTREQIEETVVRWRDALLSQENYMVGLTDAPIPFKYELIDGTHFIMHEAIGHSDEGRMNAFCVSGMEFCKKPISDFEIIWNSIPATSRKRRNVANWIDRVLRENYGRK